MGTFWVAFLRPDGVTRDLVVCVRAKGHPNDTLQFVYEYRGSSNVAARGVEDGSQSCLDATFGSGGKVRTEFGKDQTDRAFGVAVQNDGRIVAVGSTETDGAPAIQDFALSLDASFGGK